MSGDHEYSGDYGYDLLHEVRTAVHIPAARTVLPVRGLRAPGGELDPDGDLGYDQAHER
ncbi:hypothetical protein ACQPWY_22200 [Pseudonocardia xinjiangensis]|uniref:hypothetical protein n=1 Tax=Pseudonocardia xinjiangensis TaxID=75289 RepID=UPI003D93B671